MYYAIIAVIIAIDQITKYFVRSGMQLNSSIPVVENFFHISYIQNTGAAFSILEGQRWLLILLPIVVISIMFVYLIKKARDNHVAFNLSIALIIAGGIGNLIDRTMLGYVVDFFDFRIWPIFNVADISVCVGCGLLIIYFVFIESKLENQNKNQS